MSIDQEFECLKSVINGWQNELQEDKVSHGQDSKERMKKENALKLLKLHLINFEFLVIAKRRKAHLKWARKQRRLRDHLIQVMHEFYINYIDKVSSIIIKHVIDYNNCTNNNSYSHSTNNNNKSKATASMRSKNSRTIDIYSDVILLLNAQEWLETFRMSNKTFTTLCVRLWQAKQESPDDTLLEMEKKVGLALYILAKGINVHSLAHMFNVTFEEIETTLQWFVNIFLNVLASALLRMPTTEQEDEDIRKAFQEVTKMPPLTIGVMGIYQLNCPNSSNKQSPILQVLVDDCLLFRKVEITLDQKPTLFICHTNDIKYIRWSVLNGKNVSSFVAAPAYYPLRTWLMKMYTKPQKPYHFKFNEAMKHLYTYPETALRRLYGRWQILTSFELLDDQQLKNDILKVCCALHNMVEELEEYYDNDWLGNVNIDQYKYDVEMNATQCFDDRIAMTMRDTIALWIQNQN